MPPSPPIEHDPRSRRRGPAAIGFLVLCALGLLALFVVAWFQTGSNTSGLPPTLDDGEQPGAPLGVLATLGIFVGGPVAVTVVVTALVMLPTLVRGPAYRPARGWSGDATWFSGPDDAETAVREARVGAGTRGGARGSW